jgi:hypothetical protein
MPYHATHIYSGISANNRVKSKAEIHSFEDAAAFVAAENERHCVREYRYRLASNVTVCPILSNDGKVVAIAIRLYQTNIITYFPDGTFEADNGGYNTPTTSSRCNQFGPKGWFFYHKQKKLTGRSQGFEEVVMGKGIRIKI